MNKSTTTIHEKIHEIETACIKHNVSPLLIKKFLVLCGVNQLSEKKEK
jgi:hypothetical protein